MDKDLQKAISKGAKLKKTATNDRSCPVLDAGKSSGGGGGAGGGSAGGGGMGGPLFASKGMPQLRPTGPRSDIRPNASLPFKSSSALPSANAGLGPKMSVPPSRPQNTFGNGPIPPPPPRDNPGARPVTRPAFNAQRAPAPAPALPPGPTLSNTRPPPGPTLSNTRPPPPPNRGLPNPSKPAPPSGFKGTPPVIPSSEPSTSKVSPFARPGAPAPPPNFRGGGPRASPPEQKNSAPTSSAYRPPSFSSPAANKTTYTGATSGGKIPNPPPNIPYIPESSPPQPNNAVPPPPSRVTPQMKTPPPPKVSAPGPAPPRAPPVAAQSVPVNRGNLPALPNRGPPPIKQNSVTKFSDQPPPPARANPPLPPPNSNRQWGKSSTIEEFSPMHSLPASRPRNAAPPPPPPGPGRVPFKSTSPPPSLPSSRAAPPLPPARSTTPPLNNPPPLPDRDRGPPNRAFSPNGTSRPAPAPPSSGMMPSAPELERKFNFPRDLPQPIAFKSAPKTYPSHDQEHATRNRPGQRAPPAPIVTDPTKRPPPPPPPV